MTRFADLEEVRLRVRDPLVSQLFAEAVSAYDNNALRGATVTLWTAVVFDIVAKFSDSTCSFILFQLNILRLTMIYSCNPVLLTLAISEGSFSSAFKHVTRYEAVTIQ